LSLWKFHAPSACFEDGAAEGKPNAFSDQNDAVAWPQLGAVDQMIESEKLVSGDE